MKIKAQPPVPTEPEIVLKLTMEEAKRLWALSYKYEVNNPMDVRFYYSLGPVLKKNGVTEVDTDSGNTVSIV